MLSKHTSKSEEIKGSLEQPHGMNFWHNCMLQVLHKMPYDRRRKASLLSQMINGKTAHFNILLSSCGTIDSSSPKDVLLAGLFTVYQN